MNKLEAYLLGKAKADDESCKFEEAESAARKDGEAFGRDRKDPKTGEVGEFNFGEWAGESVSQIMPNAMPFGIDWEDFDAESQDEIIDAWFEGYYSA